MKECAIAHADKVFHICADDKSTIPVTDLGVYCGAVPRQRRVIATRDVTPSVGDHDFVQFQVDIEPGMQYNDVSFYRGTPTVIFKTSCLSRPRRRAMRSRSSTRSRCWRIA
jgi:hypothetical protein